MATAIENFEQRFGGYALRDRIGAGGYGEVWKAEAPGGLAKAVKFVYGILGEERASRELKALQRIKEVRHPFLLSLERIEIIDGRLVIVTELADSSLKERFQQCRDGGLPGIPRDELLKHLSDAAEALDYMSQRFSLQHLDIKPENLLILGGRIKVADFGLVKEIENSMVSIMGGMTPVYAAPELFDGGPSRHSDQYSLAIVYQEMLSGALPFPGKTTAQLAGQHLRSQPLLSSLPRADRPIIARALAKDPQHRFPDCRTLIESLLAAKPSHPAAQRSDTPKIVPCQPHSTTNVTLVCDTKSPLHGAASDEIHPSLFSDSSEKGLSAASAVSLAEISSKNFSPSLKEALAESDRPSHSSSEVAPSVSPDAWLDRDGRPPLAALPPLQIAPSTSLRPVLVIGAGGAAGGVIRKLHARIREQWKNDLPCFRTLLLDADPRALLSASPPDAADLPAGSKLLVSLQRLEKYHEIAAGLLRWLDRRWLYNIPRSGRPEGLRPLGRLAFVDHAAEILLRLNAILAQLLAPESLDITAQLTALTVASAQPEIYLISSLGGGTGSGMIFDLAYAVRKTLAENRQEPARLCGILTFSAPRQPDERKLALANAHAALRELRYYRSYYPGEPSCGLEPSTAGGPFDETYCLDWGEDLDENRFNQAQQQLADYLFANTLAPQRSFFDACRAAPALPMSAPGAASSSAISNHSQNDPPAPAASPAPGPSSPAVDGTPCIKTLGLRRLAFSRSDIPPSWVNFFCRQVINRWQGIDKNNAYCATARLPDETPRSLLFRQSPQQPVEEQAAPRNAPRDNLYLDDLLNEAFARSGASSSQLNDLEFCKMLQNSCGDSAWREADAVQLKPGEVFQALDLFLGSARTLAHWNDSPQSSLQKHLLDVLHNMGRREIPGLVNGVLQSHGPLPSALAAIQSKVEDYLAAIRREDEQNHRSQEHLRELIARSEQVLSAQTAVLSSPKKSWWPFKYNVSHTRSVAPCWLEYAQMRRDLIVLQAMSFLLQALKSDLCALGDKLRDLQHELHRLAERFPVENPPSPIEDDADPAPEPNQAAVNEQLQKHTSDLMKRCIDCCRDIPVLEANASPFNVEQAFQLADTAEKQLRSAVEDVLLSFLRPVMFRVWSSVPPNGNAIAWQDIFAAAKPLLSDCGGAARVLLSSPAPLLQPLKQACIGALGIEPAALASSEEQILVCFESDGLSLPRVAAHCLKGDLELTSLARRLHARTDIAWSSPPRSGNASEPG